MASNINAHRRRPPAANKENGRCNACAYPRNVAIRPLSGAWKDDAGLDVAIRPRSGGPPRDDATAAASNSALFVLGEIPGKTFPGVEGDAARRADRALRNRFDRLPIHKMCHDRSDNSLRKLRRAIVPSKVRRLTRLCDRVTESGNRRDCLGMTPLHILACSTKHDLAIYRLVIDKYPENLITKDGWGDVPLLYAFWGNAPRGVINLLVERQRALFPAYQLDWAGMVETMGRARYLPGWAGASLSCIKSLLDVKRSRFPNQHVDWEKALTEWAAEDTSNAAEPHAPGFHQDAFKHLVLFGVAERVNSLALLASEALTEWAAEDTSNAAEPHAPGFHQDAFKHLILFGIAARVNSLGVAGFRIDILNEIDDLCWFVMYRQRSTERLFSMLAHYEHLDQLRKATSILELSLWKAGIDRFAPDGREERDACRVRCGADVVVPNVLSFLL
eukprot:CAMPEP_0172573244 /NCGR_PEP_ID=MMETSP1067-20121228/136091_1 /TAXON_ID=265564 ORGANISM="Thalassiosira punctigera, Strain Tpunct2005C2" /NCGR_SAMPLE_ID=MMETSP1067 /ASSEMBLY_ACC=CAM_ASM_000444 /LENGTH=445 /DNA_ID=CAMNT_0013365841 /DNA_START=67 /DNA_END=1405 /DNA_ORIENTATION=-